MKCYKLFRPLVSMLLVLVSTGIYAQKNPIMDSLGRQIYDSVEMNLQDGAIMQRYLPFDVPFRLTGDATNISFIKLEIIETDYTSCCSGKEKEGIGLGRYGRCDCECESITDERLRFFTNVRSMEQGAPLDTALKLEELRIRRNTVNAILDEVQLRKPRPRELFGTWSLDQFADIESPGGLTVSPYLRRRLGLTQLHNQVIALGGNFRTKNAEVEDIKRDPIVNSFLYQASKRNISEQSRTSPAVLRYQQLEREYDSLGRALKRIIPKLYRAALEYTLALSDSISLLERDSTYFADFMEREMGFHFDLRQMRATMAGTTDRDKYQALLAAYAARSARWTTLVQVMESRIQTDSMAICVNCDFDYRQCNTICSWNRDDLRDTVTRFFLSIPPLRPHRAYSFFFEVIRTTSQVERDSMKRDVVKDVIFKIDSMASESIQMMKDWSNNLEEIRDELLHPKETSLLTVDLVRTMIENHIKLKYTQRLKKNLIELPPIRDKARLRSFINEIITHKLYGDVLHESYKKLADSRRYPLPALKVRGQDLQRYRQRFYLANQGEAFELLATLDRIVNLDSSGSSLDALKFYQKIQRDVPAGLIPYGNLQKMSLRDLDKVNDFDVKGVEVYIGNLKGYFDFLGKVQKFVGEGLGAESGALRNRLFGGVADEYVTRSSVAQGDNNLKNLFLAYAADLMAHQNDVSRLLNMYKNYQDNITSIHKHCGELMNKLLENSRSVQLAVARQTGGMGSGNFLTRTHWAVTADVGIAFILPFKAQYAAVTPYFGANFNWQPINRNAHYALIKRTRRVSLDYAPGSKPYKDRVPRRNLLKASSFVVGFTVMDLAVPGVRGNLITPVNLNLLTGYGLRLTDAGRFSIGAIWMKKQNENPVIQSSVLRPYVYVSLSFDIDVAKVLGNVGRLLTAN